MSHFIDDYRLEESFIIRLSKVIGQSEYIRLQNSNITQRLVKQIEYLVKLKIAFGLGLLFLLGGSYLKAKYLILVRWNVLKGYYISEKL